MKRIAAAWLALVLVVATGSAAANVNNGKGPSKTPPAIAVSGDTTVNGAAAINGVGFASRKPVFLVFDDGTLPILTETSRDGTFSTTWTPLESGQTSIVAYQMKKKNGWEYATTSSVYIGP